MSTRTKYLFQGLFFLLFAAFCLYMYLSGKAEHLKRFSLYGTIFAGFVGLIFLKNAFKK